MSTDKARLETLITADNRPFIRASVEARAEIKKLSDSIVKEFGVSAKEANNIASASFKKTQQAIQQTNQSLKDTLPSVRSLLIGFAAFKIVTTPILAASRAYYDFSRQLANLSAITQATGKDLEFLKNASMDLGQTTQFSAAQVAEAFKLVGATKGDLLSNLPALKQVTESVIKLATAADIDLKTAAETTGQVLNQFNLNADQSDRVVNALAAASRNGSAEVNSLAQSLKYAGPVAAALNISLEDTLALLELLAKGGRRDTQGGTDLRQFLIRLSTQANPDINPSVVGIDKALENLRKISFTPETGKNTFGVTGLPGALIIKQYAADFKLVRDGVTATSAAQEQAKIVADNYAASIDRLQNSFKNLGVAIGESSSGGGLISGITNKANAYTNRIRSSGLVSGTIAETFAPRQTVSDIALLLRGLTGNIPEVLPSVLPQAPTDFGAPSVANVRRPIGLQGAISVGNSANAPASKFINSLNLLGTGSANIADAFRKTVESLEKSRSALEALFPKDTTGQDYISANTPKNGDTRPQAVDEAFTNQLGKIRDKIDKGNFNVTDDIKILKSLSQGQFFADDGNGGYQFASNKGMIEAIKSLEKATALQNTSQDVNVKIEVDNDGFIRAFATSARGQNALIEASKTAARNEAQQTGF